MNVPSPDSCLPVLRALRFAAEAGTVKRVVVTATMASICGSQREKNPDHLWSELDKNDAPQTGYSKGKTAAEAKASPTKGVEAPAEEPKRKESGEGAVAEKPAEPAPPGPAAHDDSSGSEYETDDSDESDDEDCYLLRL